MRRIFPVRTSRMLAVALGLALGAAPWLLLPPQHVAKHLARPGEIPLLNEALRTADSPGAPSSRRTAPVLGSPAGAEHRRTHAASQPSDLAALTMPAEPAVAAETASTNGPTIIAPGEPRPVTKPAEPAAAPPQEAKPAAVAPTMDHAGVKQPQSETPALTSPAALSPLAEAGPPLWAETEKTPLLDADSPARAKSPSDNEAPVRLPPTVAASPGDSSGGLTSVLRNNSMAPASHDPPAAPLGQAIPAEAAPQPLPPVADNLPRSEQLESLAREADKQIRHGFELANRGAYFAAQAEFVAALRLVAQALDAEHRTSEHSQALSNALLAIREAQDFLPHGAKTEADLDLPTLVAGHRTPALKSVPAADLRAFTALRTYFTYAQEQLSVAAGHEVAGSMALYALGKLHTSCARLNVPEMVACQPKAKVFYQAALLTVPDNFMALNDLGVLLAQDGNYREARVMLERSVALQRNSAVLANLALVYRQLTQQDAADRAHRDMEMARRLEQQRRQSVYGGGGLVTWLDPGTFAQTGNVAADPPRPAVAATPAAASGATR
jgi:tetratricopeptide (TPR) repeat protein